MYLSSRKTAALSSLLGLLSEDASEQQVRLGVGQAMLQLLEADYFASFVWDHDANSFGHGITINMDPANLARYQQYYQFHDPITHLLRERRVPTLVTQVMAQRDLVKTEFFNDFLDRDGLYHGVNLHAFANQRHIGDLRIWRHRRRPAFQKDTLDLLTMLNPAVTASLERRRSSGLALATESLAANRLAPQSNMATGLSIREGEVAERICRGYSDKEIAAELNIGFSTVRSHVDRIFQKLAVRTRTQLVARLKS